jgi:hypothetical protein
MRTKLDLAGIFCIASLALSMPLAAQTMPRAAGSPSASPSVAVEIAGSEIARMVSAKLIARQPRN